MALQSKLFRGDSRLEAAAVSDPAHIVQGAKGPHVSKIQQALIKLDGAAITADGNYGPKTAAAVSAFKSKRRILNSQGRIDNIVGKKTIAALDAGMLASEQASGGAVSGGTNNGAKFGLNFAIPAGLADVLQLPPDVLTVPIRHTLIYFSGVVDQNGFGGVLLQGNHGQDVLTDMENLNPPAGSIKSVIGFGGSLINNNGVEQALAFIRAVHDPRGRLIIYGFSAGGVNAMELCRRLSTALPNLKVKLLVTVDVAAGPATPSVNRSVAANVEKNMNYFQTSPSLNQSRGDRNTGPGPHTDVDCDGRFPGFGFIRVFRHGGMQDLTRNEAVSEMTRALNSP